MEIVRPTLLLDKEKCIGNIDRIVAKADKSKVNLRPHFKTHQSKEIGRWFSDRGVTTCTVSSLKMATYFAEDGWNDITVAFPVNYLEVDTINQLAATIKLNLLVSSPNVLPQLLRRLLHPVNIYIDIDTGYHRTGFQPDNHQAINQVLDEIESSSFLHFEGFLSHAGHTYKHRLASAVEVTHRSEVVIMNTLADTYSGRFPKLKLSIGDTPAASIVDRFEGIDEIRPGNLVFYDLTQHLIGSCSLDQIAIAMACPVVASNVERNEIIIYGGGVHFSKDYLVNENGQLTFGAVVSLNKNGWDLPPTKMYVKSLSQEHGIIHAPDEEAKRYKPGDLLGVLPVHACLMADAMGSYHTISGDLIKSMNSSS